MVSASLSVIKTFQCLSKKENIVLVKFVIHHAIESLWLFLLSLVFMMSNVSRLLFNWSEPAKGQRQCKC